MAIRLITDSACDLPLAYVQAHHIDIASLQVNIKGEFYKDDLGQTVQYDTFYQMLREGELTSTSQVNIHTFEELFEGYVLNGDSIIFIGLASVLSGTVNSALMARENMLEKYKNADITIIDSKSATLGEGALVYGAVEQIEKGASKEEVIEWILSHREKVVHAIVVDDLNFLKRGGRISSTTSVVGSLLNIKPSVKLDLEGKVIQGPKLKGTKAVFKFLVNTIEEKGIDLEETTIFVAHGDDEERAIKLKEMILEALPVKEVIINPMGAVIGTHVGPDALGVLFVGKER